MVADGVFYLGLKIRMVAGEELFVKILVYGGHCIARLCRPRPTFSIHSEKNRGPTHLGALLEFSLLTVRSNLSTVRITGWNTVEVIHASTVRFVPHQRVGILFSALLVFWASH